MLMLNLIDSSLETGSLLVSMAMEVCPQIPHQERTWLRIISGQPPDVATLGCITAFNSKFMFFYSYLQSVTEQQGFYRSFLPNVDDFNEQSLLWGSPLTWMGLSQVTLQSEVLPTQLFFFPFLLSQLSNQHCDIKTFFFPTIVPFMLYRNSFPPIYLLHF